MGRYAVGRYSHVMWTVSLFHGPWTLSQYEIWYIRGLSVNLDHLQTHLLISTPS